MLVVITSFFQLLMAYSFLSLPLPRVHILSSCVAREIFPLCFCRILQVSKIKFLRFHFIVDFADNC